MSVVDDVTRMLDDLWRQGGYPTMPPVIHGARTLREWVDLNGGACITHPQTKREVELSLRLGRKTLPWWR